MKILLLLTRNPFGRATGRKRVINTIIESLISLGHDLDACIFDNRPSDFDDSAFKGRLFWMGKPKSLNLFISCIKFLFFKNKPLNETIYYSRRKLSCLLNITANYKYDMCIADMIRMAVYAEAVGIPWILDMDDLLSKRYKDKLNNNTENEHFFGYAEKIIPKFLKFFFMLFFKNVLIRESGLLADRELYWAKKADAVSLVSYVEAEILKKEIMGKVYTCPMSVNIPKEQYNLNAGIKAGVFVGGMDYQPNLDALRYYSEKILPLINADKPLSEFECHIIGNTPADIQKEFAGKPFLFLGYVDDLFAALSRYPIFVAPIVTGTGVKTKILEAFALGLPVITTRAGVESIPVTDQRHCLIADSPEEFVYSIKEAIKNQELRNRLSINCRNLVKKLYSPKILKNKWELVINDAKKGCCKDHNYL